MAITAFRASIDFMQFVRMWPKTEDQFNPGKWFFIRFALIACSSLIYLTSSVLHLVMVAIPKKSFYHVAEDLVTITAQVGVYYYISAFIPQQKLAARVFLRLSDFKTYGKPPDYNRHTQILRYIAKVYRWGLHSVVLSYFLEPILTKSICEKQNRLRDFDDICGLVTNSWMPFDIADFPNKAILYLLQTYSIFWTYESSSSLSFIIIETTEHVLIRIRHLKKMLKKAIETENYDLREDRMRTCLKYHNDILELASDVDKVYVNSLFVHVLFTGVLFGIMGFGILTVGVSIKTMSLFTVCLAAAAFSSFGAQRLYDESLSVAEEVYNSKWYERDYKFQKNLIVIIRRAAKPITLHAGPFAQLANTFLLAIFKSAYSYLTLLTATSQ